MNIARYIGLFLMKNHSCYVEGLGTLRLREQPARFDGQLLHASRADIQLEHTQTPDDLANFIATNEHTSLSNVFNAIHNFTTSAKAALDAGQEVIIPHTGKFIRMNGKVHFTTSAELQYIPTSLPSAFTGISTIETVLPETKKKTTWQQVLLAIALLAILIGSGIYIYDMYLEQTAIFISTQDDQPKDTVANHLPIAAPASPVDTVKKDTASTQPVVTPAVTTKPRVYKYNVVLKNFYNLGKANESLEALKSKGNNVHIETKDSLKYSVVMTVRTNRRDTARVLDSLGTLFNPGGVYIR